MINRKWMKIAGGIALTLTLSLQASNYIILDDSLVFPFERKDGFFVSPVQCKTELLAPFDELRGSYRHEGIDLEVEFGTPLYAIEDGKIIKAAPDSKGLDAGGGHMVFIDHGNGVQSRYMHLSAYAVRTGDEVKAGDVIGFSGDSGDATKALLHYELRVDDVPVDPTFILESNDMFGMEEIPFLVPQT
ncbi:MAG: M23 family metallopeptidase [Zhenhengia sp.]|jgi:murein DD-endopeptidase MepM/ murein hydrolase activator NlpD|uniref:M23 family metallopeptidase n=1 Tax=Zhenhengia sp. TaxID=2944208 RepID=UPI002912B65C|nr:M23 family metallopeptidase [Clostridiales bacterium]MDU6855330.1 M23 family metallopeptidase [Clostridiales bacterium]MDU6975141.1 M23 family metallopeptidase [Clostridiales bacterium]